MDLFLETVHAECAHSARIRTDTTLDQDCVLKATVQVCAACMVVSIVDNLYEFQHSSSRADCTFRCKIRESNTGRKHVCQLKAFELQSVEATAMACLQAQDGPEKASALSVILARHWALIGL